MKRECAVAHCLVCLKRDVSKAVLNRRADYNDGVIHRVRGSGQMLVFFFGFFFFVFFAQCFRSHPFPLQQHPPLPPPLPLSFQLRSVPNLFLNKKIKNLVQNKALKMIVRQYFDTQ